MSYVKHILLPDEEIWYDGHVHPCVLVPGILWIGFAAFILSHATNTGGGSSIILNMFYSLAESFPSTTGLYNMLRQWQMNTPDISLEIKVVALGIAMFGVNKLSRQAIIMQTTELVVTNYRIIAKSGMFTIVTLEMDRTRVAGVTIHQTLVGRLMGYGHIHIQGFTTSIGGLPVMVNPRLVERFVC